MKKRLSIISVSSEVMPYSKTGGLGTVARALPRAFYDLEHDVTLITPLYGKVIDKKKYKLDKVMENVSIIVDRKETKVKVNFYKAEVKKNMPIYFIENEKYFSRRKNLYGSQHENARFLLFDLAAIKLIKKLEIKADVLQCHDWQTGLIPYFLSKGYFRKGILEKILCVYTIHNLVFQFGHDWWTIKNGDKDDGRSSLPNFDDRKVENVNFAKRGIINADLITAVSEQYKKEIITKDFGEDLHRILQNREDKLFGIVNGIDYDDYNPKTDPGLIKKFDIKSLHRKKANKVNIQKIFGLPINDEVPVIVMTSRIVEQKGFDLIKEITDPLLRANIQMIILGEGDKGYIKFFQKVQKKHPKKLAVVPSHELNQKYETSALAGGDIFLLPSRFEPCGINQLISMRYGCVPVVRTIGGLADSIATFNPKTMQGNGFRFSHYDSRDLLVALTRALETYKYPDVWKKVILNGMKESFSWEIPAKKYITLFKKIIQINGKNGKNS